MNIKRFYTIRLLNFAYRHTGYLRIAKHFLCPGCNTINMNTIQKSSLENEFYVESVQNTNTFYIVNSEIGICICLISMMGAPCKHQDAVLVKFHISIFNFLSSLTSNDRMIYAYVTLSK